MRPLREPARLSGLCVVASLRERVRLPGCPAFAPLRELLLGYECAKRRYGLALGLDGALKLMRRFGEKLRALRLKRGLTMRALADVLGLKSHGFIGDLESGRKHPSLELAVTLADYFGVSVDQLARDELEIEA